MGKQVITSDIVRQARQGGHTAIAVPVGALITMQAREDAARAGIALLLDAAPAPAVTVQAVPVQAACPQAAPQAFSPFVPHIPAWTSVPQTYLGRPVAAPVPAAPSQAMPAQAVSAQAMPAQSAPAGCPCAAGAASAPVTSLSQVCAMQQKQPMFVSSFTVPAVVLPAQPVQPAQPAPAPAAACPRPLSLSSDDLFSEVRRQVLSQLPAGASAAQVDEMIRKALAVQGPGCGGSCVACAKASAATPAAPNSGDGAWLTRAGNAVRVDSRALPFTQGGAGVGMMQVLAPQPGAASLAAGYVQWEAGAFSWTFERDEIVVVLEGEMLVRTNGGELRAAAGDICAFAGGTQATFESHGRVRYVSVFPGSPAAATR